MKKRKPRKPLTDDLDREVYRWMKEQSQLWIPIEVVAREFQLAMPNAKALLERLADAGYLDAEPQYRRCYATN